MVELDQTRIEQIGYNDIPGVALTESNVIAEFIKKTKIQDVLNWSHKNSLWFVSNAMGCCGVEEIAGNMAHYGMDRFGIIPRNSPKHADVLLITGYVTKKYLSALKRIWDQMPSPKWVICYDDCSISGGPFYESYSTVQNVDEIFPVDVYVPSCPPRPEAFVQAFVELQKKIEAKKDKGTEY
ncbi:NADH-quinone oxidoreductase subunit B [Methanolobus sp. ZRKC5]|uniref:NADH-quinone oxidoreductase subunit B n=1 Tax=Methanolobus sp. ZRKC5 TaxID=3136295 RepID=UPI00313BCB41